MGFDCGFDIYPRLEATAVNKESYQQFLDGITHTYGDIYDREGRRTDGKVLSTSTDFDHSDRAYMWFMVGECPHMPSNPDRCNYFLRFSSKISGRLTTPAEPYIRGVHSIALRYFGSRVHFWHEMNETGDERQWGYYDWREVHDASRTLRELEAGQDWDPKNRVWEERQETTSMPSDTNLSPACGTSRLGLEQPLLSAALPRNGMEKNVYAIRPISGKGQGLVATSKIHKGARILSEAPIFKVRRDEHNHQVFNDQIVSALKSLDRDRQRAFFSLHNVYGKSHTIARTNVLPVGSEADEGGLFLEASRINHSCRHNAQNTWNENIGRLTIHALCDIEEGQEITISYLSRRMEYTERRRLLQAKFCFDCECELCLLPPSHREESDHRLSKIQAIHEVLGDLDPVTSDYNVDLHLVRTILRLFEEEGIRDACVPKTCYDAFRIAIANGDETRAQIFAEGAYTTRVIIEGDDSPAVSRAKQLVDRPAQHWLYKASVASPQETSPLPEMDGLDFDDWLWRENEQLKHPANSSADDSYDVSGEDLRYRYDKSSGDERSESFDSLSTSSIWAALSRSLDKP
ncbi:SET domain-containing protein 5 [Beauveria bassiana ARSEF 2860]|uniref:SET domain-containing protein 5 n=1 Tax=Beauveria bassiana (strain ARSEF 2860) TaxID=655819 RepID=J5J2U7_BEAB2|nr:SET domain-containing protein 5 [Beauveria bassiana ARSEF 2860]EJP61138.1 SET domain-containing protein 5 [Beauveria bassiana ARSEF 2860]